MARQGITFEQVKAAAEQLVSEGREPSIRAVRERLHGTGSPNTIHRHLSTWRGSRSDAAATGRVLPEPIARAINDYIQHAVMVARAEAEVQLARARTDASDLAVAGEALEVELSSLTEQLLALTRERDVLLGRCVEQGEELGRLRGDLRDVQEVCGRVERAQAACAAVRDSLVEQLRESHERERIARQEAAQYQIQIHELLRAARETEVRVARYEAEAEALRVQLAACAAENRRPSGLSS